ncbi:sigma 54-interacting transcriptional regulator [Craterilacuibacter sp. RT1T]|uniref:sigma-54 interaction domain-containing protein n=1 Tax=Craterilacuibacter sp. RT1T TaxID=2942211 RepID=UPI0020BF2211|nr:sigma 54-interacting transcriptional regulator [Craterilacuibacter sp. RT1T]MCL6264397.1 sigma 54-interacting transcriptional regulator [Craterilacuibacter sp. RT1T]
MADQIAIKVGVGDGALMVDAEGRISFMSESCAQLRGVPMADAIGERVDDVFPATLLHQTLETGLLERHTPWSDGKVLELLVSRIPVMAHGRVCGVLGYVDKVLRAAPGKTPCFDNLPRLSPQARLVREQLKHVAAFDTTVLLTGESGAGKEMFARAIHECSRRAARPFIKLNCAAINDALAESELFGYDKGAFTGASRDGHKGKFELADQGTLFLDEIGELPPGQQAKLLRALQEGQVDRIGAERSRHVDVRLIAATNRDLAQMVREGTFRADLYYRLNVVQLRVPALREQVSDIPVLVERLWGELCSRHHHYSQLSQSAVALLAEQAWPGNIRELKHTLERALVLLPQGVIGPDEIRTLFDAALGQALSVQCSPALDADCLLRTLAACGNNRSEAARRLGISRALLYKKLHQFGLWELAGGA